MKVALKEGYLTAKFYKAEEHSIQKARAVLVEAGTLQPIDRRFTEAAKSAVEAIDKLTKLCDLAEEPMPLADGNAAYTEVVR